VEFLDEFLFKYVKYSGELEYIFIEGGYGWVSNDFISKFIELLAEQDSIQTAKETRELIRCEM